MAKFQYVAVSAAGQTIQGLASAHVHVQALDNVLWGGSVVDRGDKTTDTRAIRALNAKLGADARVELTLFAVGDGMTGALKR